MLYEETFGIIILYWHKNKLSMSNLKVNDKEIIISDIIYLLGRGVFNLWPDIFVSNHMHSILRILSLYLCLINMLNFRTFINETLLFIWKNVETKGKVYIFLYCYTSNITCHFVSKLLRSKILVIMHTYISITEVNWLSNWGPVLVTS